MELPDQYNDIPPVAFKSNWPQYHGQLDSNCKFYVKFILKCDCSCQPWFTRESGSIEMAEEEGVNFIKLVL